MGTLNKCLNRQKDEKTTMTTPITIEHRIQRLEDIEAIKTLTATYALYVNKGWNGKVVDFDKLVDVLADDIRWASAAMRVNEAGQAQVIDMLKERTAGVDFAMHSFTNPIIEIAGDTATGNWLLWVAVKTGDSVNQVFQSEDLTYVRTARGWRIQSIQLHFGALLNS